ncbi:MAG: DUF3365 domain-containing protein [Pirellulales bacterium]
MFGAKEWFWGACSTLVASVISMVWVSFQDDSEVRTASARNEATTLHEMVHSSLHLMHHRFYKEDEGLPLPAVVLKEAFAEVEKERQVQLRWLAIEGDAMNVDHKPRTDFERKAAQAIRDRKGFFEQVEEGVYRRAAAIEMTNHCLKCHVPDRKSLETRLAGLVISIPLKDRR